MDTQQHASATSSIDITKHYWVVDSYLKSKGVKKWYHNYLDLYQEGVVGLLIAKSRFKEDMVNGSQFSTYAFYWVQSRVSRFLHREFRHISPEMHDVEEVEEFRGRLRKSRKNTLSLDGPAPRSTSKSQDGGEEDTLGDILRNPIASPEEVLLKKDLQEKVNALVTNSFRRDKAQALIAQERLLSEEPVHQREIGQVFGFTRARVSQLEIAMIKKIAVKVHKMGINSAA